MCDFSEISNELVNFRNERDWDKFHNPKDLALAINIEAGELLELFLWKEADEANQAKVKEELKSYFLISKPESEFIIHYTFLKFL